MTRVGLLGAQGRMGQWVCQLANTEFSRSLQLNSRIDRGDALEPLLDEDVVIDFSNPSAVQLLLELALRSQSRLPAFVIGSTGWNPQELRLLDALAERTPVLKASNFSLGILLIREILDVYSPVFLELGFSPVLVEAHHQHKKDAPSGTALTLQQAIYPSHPESVQTHSIRSGEVIGDHDVIFYGRDEKIQLAHNARERSIFARGALQASLWLANQRQDEMRPRRILQMKDFFESIKSNARRQP